MRNTNSSSEAPENIDDINDALVDNDSDQLFTGDELSITRDRLFALPSEHPIHDSDSLTSDDSDAEVYFNPTYSKSTYKPLSHQLLRSRAIK